MLGAAGAAVPLGRRRSQRKSPSSQSIGETIERKLPGSAVAAADGRRCYARWSASQCACGLARGRAGGTRMAVPLTKRELSFARRPGSGCDVQCVGLVVVADRAHEATLDELVERPQNSRWF